MAIAIVGAARTPMGGLGGVLSSIPAPELGGIAIKAALDGATIAPSNVDELLMGCVLPAGLGQAPARQAGFAAGLSIDVPATTVNKMCGSGMKTVMMAHDQLTLGNSEIMVAGGMESMSLSPYLLPKMRSGARLGHGEVKDHMFLDGLEDAYDKGRLMGTFAEDCAEKFQFTRQSQDDYALRSLSRALDASGSGVLSNEIAQITLKTRNGDITIDVDEQPKNALPEKIPNLKPAFRDNGTVTAANSSSISDGAAALVLATPNAVADKNLIVRANILGHSSHAQEPGLFTTAPIQAAKKLMDKLDWDTEDVDLWEVNEAFAVVPMAFAHELNLNPEKPDNKTT